MVSTRRAAPEPAQAEHDEEPTEASENHAVKTEPKSDLQPDARADSPAAQKRKDAPTEEENASKRRQVSPPGENGAAVAAVKQEPEATGANDEDKDAAVQVNECQETVPAPTRVTKVSNHAYIDELARQLLKLFACTTFPYLSQIVSRPGSTKGAKYKALYEKFKEAREKLPLKDKFIDPTGDEGLQNNDTFVRRANTVTFAASMLGSRDASFRQLNEGFFVTFVSKSGRLLSQHAEILLGLKTQGYISQALETGSLREEVLDELFPSDMATKLLALRPEAKNNALVASEQKFIKQLTARRRSLSEKKTPTEIRAVKEKHSWNEVVTGMITYIKQHLAELVEIPLDQIDFMNQDGEAPQDITDMSAVPRAPVLKTDPGTNGTAVRPVQAAATSHPNSAAANQQNANIPNQVKKPVKVENNTGNAEMTEDIDLAEILSRANAAADEVLNDFQGGAFASHYHTPTPDSSYQTPPQYIPATSQSAPMPPQYALPAAYQHAGQRPPGTYGAVQQQHQAPGQAGSPSHAPPGGQSQPTHQLYELARQATTGRAAQPAPRRTGTQSQRRPWTQEEEQALMQGLDQVKGPHWSMILQLYGHNGKHGEVLKDRNQVQLKDKARNLKLWFLKSGVEVPVNLKSVTGELKTRAPAAVRNAAQQAATAPSSGHMHHTQSHANSPHNYTPMQSPYAPSAGVYAPTAPATSTMSDITSTTAIAGPSHVDSSDAFWNQDVVNQEADEAAQQAIASLASLLGGDEPNEPATNEEPNGTSGPSDPSGETNGTASTEPQFQAQSTDQVLTDADTVPTKTKPESGTPAEPEHGQQGMTMTAGIDYGVAVAPDMDEADIAAAAEAAGQEALDMDEAAIAAAAEAAAALATEGLEL